MARGRVRRSCSSPERTNGDQVRFGSRDESSSAWPDGELKGACWRDESTTTAWTRGPRAWCVSSDDSCVVNDLPWSCVLSFPCRCSAALFVPHIGHGAHAALHARKRAVRGQQRGRAQRGGYDSKRSGGREKEEPTAPGR